MKCQILFSGKNKKNISKCCLLKILPRVLSPNYQREVQVCSDLVEKYLHDQVVSSSDFES